ncbi:hypothetical protein chiPu_0028392, partial [Chiloscyllium punctatum]|nr:hypothetical protein [Chiloscyllium punctatum]
DVEQTGEYDSPGVGRAELFPGTLEESSELTTASAQPLTDKLEGRSDQPTPQELE